MRILKEFNEKINKISNNAKNFEDHFLLKITNN